MLFARISNTQRRQLILLARDIITAMPRFNMYRLAVLSLTVFSGAVSSFAAWSMAADEDIQVAEGLTIRLIADDELVPDCSTIACDWQGNVIASGPGYIRRLVDEDGDGRMDSQLTLVDALGHGAHGLYLEEPYVYYVATGGVWRCELDGQVSRSLKAPEKLLDIKTGGEHHAHAIRRGPDGLWYLIAGNGNDEMYALQNSPNTRIPVPRAGVLWQISDDWKTRTVWAHGFRNAYDFDFAPDRSIVTFDSDGEREVSLPWYRPTRVYRVAEGDDAGWMTRNWKRPDYHYQMPRVLAHFGRGSPTGVVRYRHERLPARLHDTNLVLDWTFGRVLAVSDEGRTEVLAQPSGTAGFAVTDIDVLPDGRVVVSVGGRGSRGGVYLLDAERPNSEALPTKWSWRAPPSPELSAVQRRIARLRQTHDRQRIRLVDFEQALLNLDQSTEESDAIDAITLLIESLGGLGAANRDDGRDSLQRAGVFDGYRSQLKPELPESLSHRAEHALLALLESSPDSRVRHEAIRGLAVLESDEPKITESLIAVMVESEDPTDALHCAIALARLPGARNEDQDTEVLATLLSIPVKTRQMGRNVDRNWTPRLVECLQALSASSPSLRKKLIEHSEFGHPSHWVFMDAFTPEESQLACQRFLNNDASRREPLVAEQIAETLSDIPNEIIDEWLESRTTNRAAWLAMARAPNAAYVESLQRAANQHDPRLRELARKALAILDVAIIETRTESRSAKRWLASIDEIQQLPADAENGQAIFVARQCAKCHNSAKALGPQLAGVRKRLAGIDLLRATVDPNHSIPDRYRGLQVLTEQGEVVTGIRIYESVDGVTLLNSEAQTLRINAEDIAELKPATKSLMPEGLLDGASTQEVADLLAYMQSL